MKERRMHLMNLKRFSTLLLCLALLTGANAALAASTLESSYTLEARDVVLNRTTSTLGVQDPETYAYRLLDREGNQLSDQTYGYMSEQEGGFQVANEDGVNNFGLIDGNGALLIPMEYGDVEWVTDRWQLGVKLEEATSDNYDYRSLMGDGYYLISAVDVFYRGAKVGSLSRNDYGSVRAYGDYFCTRDKDGNYTFYDSAFQASPYEVEYSEEFTDDYKNDVVWHAGSNQQAFTAGCTLTPENVEKSIWNDNGIFLDLQGNEIFRASFDSVRDYQGDYACVRAFGKYGLIDRQGNQILPFEYDEISCTDEYFVSGYQAVVKDGKIGYVDLNGNVTCPFVYSSSSAKTWASPFNYLQDLDGSIIVLSAAVGELPTRYKGVSMGSGDGCVVMAVENADKQAGVIDLEGNEIVPLDGTYDSSYDFDLSFDGDTVVGSMGSRQYTVYLFSHDEVVSAPAQVAEESQGLTCANCGYATGDVSMKFCPECGTAF